MQTPKAHSLAFGAVFRLQHDVQFSRVVAMKSYSYTEAFGTFFCWVLVSVGITFQQLFMHAAQTRLVL